MSGKCRPSLRTKTLENVKRSNLSQTDKDCIQAVFERLTPKKPNILGYREGREINTISYTCPVCHKHFDRDNFCKHCGQALDWSDTE